MADIPVLYSFARSGGTLVNQLLGAHPQCLVLSEVNPSASFKPVVDQAVEWLKLIAPHEAEEFSGLAYGAQITTLQERAFKLGKVLLVRDWVTVNFLPDCAGASIRPSGQLEQSLYLEQVGIRTLPLVIARRSAAVYRSIRHNFPHLQGLQFKYFAHSYLSYAQSVSGFPIIHIETLRSQPEGTLRQILGWLALDTTGAVTLMENFHTFRNCTGNTTLSTTGHTSNAQRILPPEAVEASNALLDPVLAEADRLLGYV